MMAERKKIKTKEDYDAPENSPGTHQLTERFEKLSFKNRAKAKLVIFSLVAFSRRFCFLSFVLQRDCMYHKQNNKHLQSSQRTTTCDIHLLSQS